MSRLMMVLLLVLTGAAPAVNFTDYASQFDAFASRTADLPVAARVTAFRNEFEKTAPGLYAEGDAARLDSRIADALVRYPAIRPAYLAVVQRFPSDLAAAIYNFRKTFPNFVPQMPIYLAHELACETGVRTMSAAKR